MLVKVTSRAEDWEGLAGCVRKTDPIVFPWRDRVLDIIRSVPLTGGRQAQLMLLGEGEPYRYMLRHFFPLQRRSYVSLEYDLKRALERRLGHDLDDDSVDMLVASSFFGKNQAEAFVNGESSQALTLNVQGNLTVDRIVDKLCAIRQAFVPQAPKPAGHLRTQVPTLLPSLPLARPRRTFRPLVVVKSNLVAAAGVSTEMKYRTPMPNLELEWVIARRWSVAASALFEKFSITPGYDAWHVTAYTLEGRYRLWPDGRYGGLYLGLYGRVGDYNIRRENSDAPTGNTGRYCGVGLSAGYTLPIGDRWVVEAGAAAGYRHCDVKEYSHESCDENYLDGRQKRDRLVAGDLFLRVGYRIGEWRTSR
jgi:hypothetical protein